MDKKAKRSKRTFKMSIFDIQITVKFVYDPKIDAFAYVPMPEDIIIITQNVTPKYFKQVLLHECQHILNKYLYYQFWDIIGRIHEVPFSLLTTLLDEQSALAAENSLTIYLAHEKEIMAMEHHYKEFYNSVPHAQIGDSEIEEENEQTLEDVYSELQKMYNKETKDKSST